MRHRPDRHCAACNAEFDAHSQGVTWFKCGGVLHYKEGCGWGIIMPDVNESKIKACFADNAELPIACSEDIGEEYNCQHLMSGETKKSCTHWKPHRTRKLCKDLLGIPPERWGTIRF